MSVDNVRPIKPEWSSDDYTVTLQHKPSAPDDPIAWWVEVKHDDRYVGSGWERDRDGALARARQIIAADALTSAPETLTMTPGGELT